MLNKIKLGANNIINTIREVFSVLDKIALTLLVIGGINWGCIGIFQFDIVAWIFGGQTGIVSRVIYILVGLAAIWCISLLFRDTHDEVTDESVSRNNV